MRKKATTRMMIPNYLLILPLLFVIYTLIPCATSSGANPSPLVMMEPYNNNTAPACTASYYSTCVSRGRVPRWNADNSTSTYGNNISYGESLISEGSGRFKLGFFERGRGTYLGIWYNGTYPEAIVWVANRGNPIPSQLQSRCSLILEGYGGSARLLDSNSHSYWSTGSYGGAIWLRLLDSGNLILVNREARNDDASATLWQSFDNPTDTILQGQGIDFNTKGTNLSSWESLDNPAQGYYSFQMANPSDFSYSITRNNSAIPYWKSSFYSLPHAFTSFLNTTTANSSLRLVMNASGSVQLWELDGGSQSWSIIWNAPSDPCDVNLVESTCGNFGVCDAHNGFMCKCLPGFKPNDPVQWESKDFSGECTKIGTSDTCGQLFLSLPTVKAPPDPITNITTTSAEECEHKCGNDHCVCKAYSYDPRHSNCLLWNKDLYNIQEEYYHPTARTLSIRVDIDFGERGCKNCGTNVIPYPLSTDYNCGDRMYFSFQCNTTNGQVYFKQGHNGKLFKVSHINPDQRKFVVQLPYGVFDKCDTTHHIESEVLNLNIDSSPFHVTNCSLVLSQVVEVEMSWNKPPLPACNISADCKDWPNTSCDRDGEKNKVCSCSKGYHSDDSGFLICTKVDKGMSLWVKAVIVCACGIVLLLGSLLTIIFLQKRRAARYWAGIFETNTDNEVEDIDIPFVNYESILAVTDNFSEANKLGVGGFGPVYKGNLVDGNAIAVKRLSAASVQGIEEFRNEVILIAKLQHRNLVRVLGYCIKEDEKILIYEYMVNKSLDAFLFDHTISPLLDWVKRFHIIMGIARGLLYLHQDSRLRIIHRDLKPSNILLDEELNPKISDFGLARIVAGNEMATSTARVVGTHGYMAPEYAMDGYFSIKSDVYSFGIVVLEIISGKKCNGLLHFDNHLISLLGYAWTLWDNGNPLELLDKSVGSYDSFEVKRCINVGLLCVQEDPSDRPTMSNVLLMLGGDNMGLLYPKQPVFVARKRPPSETTSSCSKLGISSNSQLMTTVEGR